MAHNRIYHFLMTSYLVPIGLGLYVLDPVLQYLSHPNITENLVQTVVWAIIFGFVMFLRRQHRKIMADQNSTSEE